MGVVPLEHRARHLDGAQRLEVVSELDREEGVVGLPHRSHYRPLSVGFRPQGAYLHKATVLRSQVIAGGIRVLFEGDLVIASGNLFAKVANESARPNDAELN